MPCVPDHNKTNPRTRTGTEKKVAHKEGERETGSGRKVQRDLTLLALEVEGGTLSQGMQKPLEAGKGKRGCPREPPESSQLCGYRGVSPVS